MSYRPLHTLLTTKGMHTSHKSRSERLTPIEEDRYICTGLSVQQKELEDKDSSKDNGCRQTK